MSPSTDTVNGSNSDLIKNGFQAQGKEPTSTSVATDRPRRDVGFHEAATLAGSHMVQNLERLEEMNPILGRNITENGFGGLTANAGMGYREWALQTIGVLTAIGDCVDQVDVYLEAALKHGATEQEVIAVINHTAGFAGNPRAVNSMRRCRARLEAARELPQVIVKEAIFRLSDHETLVRDSGGSGIPIVLIHALSMDGRMFQKLIPRLASTGTRVLTYDLRGHGHARGAPLVQSLEHLVFDLRILLDILGVDKADVVGASYGGAVAQYFALTHPSRVRSLCPMATGGQGSPVLLSRATRAENGEMPALCTEAIIRWFAPETIADNTWCVRYARAQVNRVRIKEWAAAWKAMAKLDSLPRIKDITCPMLVLCGAKDLSAPPTRMKPIHEEAAKAGRDSEYVEVAAGTHMMAMEYPDEVAAALTKFRNKLDRNFGTQGL